MFRGKRRKILEPEFSLGQAGSGCQRPTETFPLPSVATEHETSTKGERKKRNTWLAQWIEHGILDLEVELSPPRL